MFTVNIKAKITGANEVIRLNNELIKPENFNKIRDEVIVKIYDKTKEYAPVKTGKLESSIRLVKDGNEYSIIVNVPYAEYMEYGTKFFPVGTASSPRARTSTSGKACYHPFLRTAVWDVMNGFPQIIEKALFSKF
jgi:hypothetical protein